MSKPTKTLQRMRTLLQQRHSATSIDRRFKSTQAPAAAPATKDDQGEGATGRSVDGGHGKKNLDDIPGPSGLPYVGSMLKYRLGTPGIDGMKDILTDHYHKYGGLVSEKVAGKTRVHVFDPEHVKDVYRQEGKWPLIEPLVETTQLFREHFQHSPGLGNTNGNEWYRMRSGVHQLMMRPKEVAAYLPLVDDVAKDFVNHLDDVTDSDHHIKDLTMDVAKWNLENSANIAMEERKNFFTTNSEKAEKWIEAQTAIMREAGLLRYALPWYRFMPTPKWKNLVKAEEYLTSECQKMVEEALGRLKAAEERHTLQDHEFRFLRGLQASSVLNSKDIVTLVLSVMTDGLPSTAPTVLSILYCLATNPTQQDRLRDEVNSLSSLDEPLTNDAINKMTYLKACIKETLRLFPVTLEISRVCPADMTVGDYLLPEGTCLKINNFVAHRDSNYFPDPDTFHPERWLRHTREELEAQREESSNGQGSGQPISANVGGESSSDLTNHPYRFIPFGHGPRMCPGRRIAEQDLQAVTARLVQKFHVQWHGGTMGQRWETLMKPDCPLDFTFHARG
ncbi:probable cytochrome P450 CYP44 [Littorina saxatilis]|uniref:Cytochrome P450 n=1 Tax=Littorina saxatilis TaxID=31220 RepID=A0AAN9BC31_9CAEN